MSELSIVILTYNTKELTLRCLKSIFNKSWQVKFNVVVVDNNSSDQTLEAVKKEYPEVETIQNNENGGFAKGNNVALRKIKSDFVLLLNSDTQLKANSLDNLLDFAKGSNFGISSCALVNADGSFQPNAGFLPKPFSLFVWLSGVDDILGKLIPLPSYHMTDKNYYKIDREVEWVSGSVMLIKQEVFEKVGFLDEKIFMYGEDVDYCWRAKEKEIKVGWTKSAQIEHISGASSKEPKYRQWIGEFRGLLYLYKKYYGYLEFPLRILIYIFVLIRVIAFAITGKVEYAKSYAKIIATL